MYLMNKRLKIIEESLLTFLFILLIGSSVFSEEMPLYKGFPVYPPEKIPSLTEDSFTLDLRSREETLAYLKSAGSLSAEKILELESIDYKLKEYDEAKQYILDNASALGWKRWKLGEGIMHRHGNYLEYVFAKVIDDSVRLFCVVIWTKTPFSRNNAIFALQSEDDWGEINYEMKDYPAPVLIKDFPVYARSNEIEIREDSQSKVKFFETNNNSPFLNSPSNPRYDYFDSMVSLWDMPFLFGWEYYYSPMLADSEFLYKKGDTYVKAIDLKENIRIEIYDETAQIDLLQKYPPSIEKKKVIERGSYIYNGRYIRPPYTVELKDNKLLVNGIIWETFSPEERFKKWRFSERLGIGGIQEGWKLEGPLDFFNDAVYTLSIDSILIEQDGSRYSRDQCDIQKLLSGIDEAVKSNVSDEEKKERLKEVIDTPHMSDEEFNDFLTNWDGIN